ncbi:unnamed protein product [Brassica oleracea]
MVSEKSVNNYKTAPHNVDPNSYDDDQGADPNSYLRNLSLSYFAAEPLRMLRDHHKSYSGSAIAGATKRSGLRLW